jgi:release factor glutamine methyltransferase
VSNPPYIAQDDVHLQCGDLRFEPRMALASGADGLDAIRAIVRDAPDHLSADGWLLLEHGFDQGAAVRALLQLSGFAEVFTARDLEGRERVSGGVRPR